MSAQLSFKKILNNAFIVLSGNMGANIFGLLSVAIFTHSMGAEIFGYYVLFLTFIEIIDKIFNFQTWQAFIKYATDFQVRNEEHNLMMLLKYSFLIDFLSLSVAFVVACFSVDLFVSFFNIPIEYTTLVMIMSISILLRVFEISTGIFRLFDEFKIQSKILVYVSMIKLIIFGIIALSYPTFENFIYATIFSQLIAFSMKLFFSKQMLNKNGFSIKDIINETINHKLIKELKICSFIVYKNFSVSIRMISRQLDVVILAKLYGAEIVGIYKVSKEVANIIGKIIDPIYQAIYPELAKLLANGKKNEAIQVAKKISLYGGLAGLLFYILFATFGQWTINLAFGNDFSDAYYITLVYFIAVLIAIISLPLVPLMDSSGLVKYTFSNQLYATILYSIAIYPLIDIYSVYGAGIAYVLYYMFWSFLALNRIKLRFN